MRFHVLILVADRYESFPAKSALKGPFPSVCSFVNVQVVLLFKNFTANLALERFFVFTACGVRPIFDRWLPAALNFDNFKI